MIKVSLPVPAICGAVKQLGGYNAGQAEVRKTELQSSVKLK